MTNKRRTITKKTIITSVIIPLWVFAVQQFIQSNLYRAGTAALIAAALWALYEYVGLKSIPLSAEELQGLSDKVAEYAKEQTGGDSDGSG